MIFHKKETEKIELVARPDLVSNFKQKVFVSNLVSNFKRKVFVSKPVSKFLVSFHVKPRVEYYVFESNHVSKFKEKDFKRFPSDLTQKTLASARCYSGETLNTLCVPNTPGVQVCQPSHLESCGNPSSKMN